MNTAGLDVVANPAHGFAGAHGEGTVARTGLPGDLGSAVVREVDPV